MKKGFYTLVVLLISSLSYSQTTKKVLFIGNSYTYVNDLPSLVSSIATSMGDNLIYDSNCIGGYTLNAHSTNATTISKINADNWDFVVLQEQSQLPSFSPSQVATDVYPYADSLNRMIQENDSCTHTIFYMTWGRKNGDASNCAFYPPVCTYYGMQDRLRDSYVEMANLFDAEVSPVGVVWKKFREDFPLVELYNADESHPSIHGSYLAACTFYAAMYHKSVAGSQFLPVGITNSEAFYIQSAADSIVFDSLNIWRIDTGIVSADFSFVNLSGSTFDFTPDDLSGDEYFWDFGDGIADTVTNPTTVSHYYSAVGNYPAQLIIRRKCEFDTIIQNVQVNSVGIILDSEISNIEFYPNPANTQLHFDLSDDFEIKISDINGKLILSKQLFKGNSMIDVSEIANGNYIVEARSKNSVFKKSIIILK